MIKEPREEIISHYSCTNNIAGLSLIQNEHINIAIYERGITKQIDSFLNHILSKGFNTMKVSLNVGEFGSYFDSHFKDFRINYTEAYNFLKNDIQELLQQFSKICSNDTLKVFFGIVDTDMCRRFHVDMYELRMLCSYQGKGTTWLTDNNINYEALNNFESNEEIAIKTENVRQLNATDVAIIKGALYPNSKVGGLVHRSPTIEHLNEKRIVLRVDSNSLLDNINK